MNVGHEQLRLDEEFRAALDRDDARDGRPLGQDRCPECGGSLIETRSTANRRCQDCGTLVAYPPTVPRTQLGPDDDWPPDLF